MTGAVQNSIDQISSGNRPVSVGTAVKKRSNPLLGPNHHQGGTLVFQSEWSVDWNLIGLNVDVRHTSCAISQGRVRRESGRAVHCTHPGAVTFGLGAKATG